LDLALLVRHALELFVGQALLLLRRASADQGAQRLLGLALPLGNPPRAVGKVLEPVGAGLLARLLQPLARALQPRQRLRLRLAIAALHLPQRLFPLAGGLGRRLRPALLAG